MNSLWAPDKHITEKLSSAQKSLFSNLQLLWAATVHNKSQKVAFSLQCIRVFTEASAEPGQRWPARAPECFHWSGSAAHSPPCSCQCYKSWCLQRQGRAGKQAVILPENSFPVLQHFESQGLLEPEIMMWVWVVFASVDFFSLNLSSFLLNQCHLHLGHSVQVKNCILLWMCLVFAGLEAGTCKVARVGK